MSYTKIIQSGNITEIYQYERTPQVKKMARSSGVNRQKRIHLRDKKITSRRRNNIRGTVKRFIRLVWSNLKRDSIPSFLTLTCAQNVHLKTSVIWLSKFTTRLKKYVPEIKYIAVPEFQERGAVHFHILIWGLPEYVTKNERKTRNLQRIWQRGFVDCRKTDGRPALAGYLAKYLSKGMLDSRLSGVKTYSASRNVVRPLQSTYPEEFDDIADYIVPVDSVAIQEKVFMTEWVGEGRYRLYNLSKENNLAYGNNQSSGNIS